MQLIQEGKGLLKDPSALRQGGESQTFALACLKVHTLKRSSGPFSDSPFHLCNIHLKLPVQLGALGTRSGESHPASEHGMLMVFL